MKNQITLNQETLEHLRTLFNNIDGESGKSCNDYNLDLVVESEHEILKTIKELVFEKTTIKVPTIVIKLHMYDFDENDKPTPMSFKEVEEVSNFITSHGDVYGYSITDHDIVEEEISF